MSVTRRSRNSVPGWLEAVSGAILVAVLVGGVAWWSSAVVAPRDRLLECGSNAPCRTAALRDFTVYQAVSARRDALLQYQIPVVRPPRP